MLRPPIVILGVLTLLGLAVGCSDSGGVELVEAGGTVTYNGAPLAGAVVTFVPEKGPVAMGRTDTEGKFTLTTGGASGVVVGPAKVGVTVPSASGGDQSAPTMTPPKNAQEGKAFMEQMMRQQAQHREKSDKNGPKSLIPEKYTRPDTSGLTVTVSDDESKNQFPIELQ